MMGQFIATVIPECGHVIQEDKPSELAFAVQHFVTRNMIPVDYTQQVTITSMSGK